MSQKQLVIIYGPTATGKTDFALQLARQIRGEIINADVGQFYVPLSIGTAKPAWQKSTIPHHLFDILNKPEDLTVTQYRALVKQLLQEIWDRDNVPIIVGGSGFYIASIFFPPHEQAKIKSMVVFENESPELLWKKLKDIDPIRAQEIHPHDIYRIKRALDIWYATGIQPSKYRPLYKPLAPFLFIFLTRNRDQLYKQIDNRVYTMMEQGWLHEVKNLKGTTWEPFLKEKKLIGYNDIFSYLEGPQSSKDYEALIDLIAKKTRNYAKRQITFWRMLQKKLQYYNKEAELPSIEINLTLSNPEVYIKQLISKIESTR